MHNGDSISLQICTRISFPFCKSLLKQSTVYIFGTKNLGVVGLGLRHVTEVHSVLYKQWTLKQKLITNQQTGSL